LEIADINGEAPQDSHQSFEVEVEEISIIVMLVVKSLWGQCNVFKFVWT
jgi:hypothetical protein